MSFVTAFNFDAFSGDLRMRESAQEKIAISLSLMSAADTERLGFVEVRTRAGEESRAAPWKPIIKKGVEYPTFWDTRMGNFDFKGLPTQTCATCAASVSGAGGPGAAGGGAGGASSRFGNQRCQGHFGFISMPRLNPAAAEDASAGAGDDGRRLFVYNPHLASELTCLLQAECFFCHRFRADAYDVERLKCALLLADAGLAGEALHLLETVPSSRGQGRMARRIRSVDGGAADAGSVHDVPSLHAFVESTMRHNNIQQPVTAAVMEILASGAGLDRLPRAAAFLARDSAVQDLRCDIVKQALKELREAGSTCAHCQAMSPRVTAKNEQFYFHFGRKAAIDHNISVVGVLSQAQVDAWEEDNKQRKRTRTYYSSLEARRHLARLAESEQGILALLFPQLGSPTVETPYQGALATSNFARVFFLDRLPVPPLPLRLQSGAQLTNGALSADDRTRALSDILRFVDEVEGFFRLPPSTVTPQQANSHEDNIRNLQLKVNEAYSGVVESFAKKEGLFRMHMMGKRVNQACRSVISPDFTVESNEVLLPRPFARSLSFPEQVTFHAPARTALLKRCVINGPKVYPGATHIEVRKASGEVVTIELSGSEENRRKNAAKYFSTAQGGTDVVIVYRHVLSGDRLIFNRQPTLHKPSMQSYRARVLSGLKTLRFHYINAKSYNADFDGDEMNIHVPQSLECRAELDLIMDANLQYIAPTSGKPLRGLIQDHVASGVYLTLRDRFFDPATFTQLLYQALQPYLGGAATDLSTLVPVPAQLKPRPLFTGKQMVTAILRFVSGYHRGAKGITLAGMSSIQPSVYGKHAKAMKADTVMGDHNLRIVDSELVSGVLCKNQLGPSANSMAHVVYDLCGPLQTAQLFCALGRVLTFALQRDGFSMGMDDMLLTDEGLRMELLDGLDCCALGLPDPSDEAAAMSHIMTRSTNLQKDFVPARLLVPFPANQLVAMTQSGAKGSNTNAVQMALGLGQQLFDGRRVTRMHSGKTLPGFFTGENRARSHGYAMGRFVTGIRPPEYTIHAMAGRDGIIDTGVKTSRSGHLQRCLIKGLESLVARWDGSVRDSNGAVVQFCYGGDGLDPCKASMINAYEVLRHNARDYGIKYRTRIVLDEVAQDRAVAQQGDAGSAGKRGREAPPPSGSGGDAAATPAAAAADGPSPLSVDGNRVALLCAQRADAAPLPAQLRKGIEKHVTTATDYVQFESSRRIEKWMQRGKNVAAAVAARNVEWADYYRPVLQEIVNAKRIRAAVEEGEPVGLLAAQAAGEPSTQMTLNTFHSAGATVSHVTEGIPRLRELLIYASVQKCAVSLPVEKASAEELAIVQSIAAAAVPVRLVDALVPGAAPASGAASAAAIGASQLRYAVRRTATTTHVDVELYFSRYLLDVVRGRMHMSKGEHVDAFLAALRDFTKKVIMVLRGRAAVSTGAGAAAGGGEGGGAEGGDDGAGHIDGLRGAVQDPADLLEGGGGGGGGGGGARSGGAKRKSDYREADATYHRAANADSDNEVDVDSDDDRAGADGSDGAATSTSSSSSSSSSSTSSSSSSSSGSDDSDSDDESSSASSAASDAGGDNDADPDDDNARPLPAAAVAPVPKPAAAKPSKRAAGAPAPPTAPAAATGARLDYASFPGAYSSFGNKQFQVLIAPRPFSSCLAAGGFAGLAEEGADGGPLTDGDSIVAITIAITCPANVVAVIPDVLKSTLRTVPFPTWLPQCSGCRWDAKGDDPTSGELWFEGKGATIENVLQLVSLFTPTRCYHNGAQRPAIRCDKIASTDINDIALRLGIEASYRAFFDELGKLFKRYGVDARHLALICDCAMHKGSWESFNFTGIIARSSSPLFQMTFASAKKFLHHAVTRGVPDDLASISAAVLVGEKPRVGTALVSVGTADDVFRKMLDAAFDQ